MLPGDHKYNCVIHFFFDVENKAIVCYQIVTLSYLSHGILEFFGPCEMGTSRCDFPFHRASNSFIWIRIYCTVFYALYCNCQTYMEVGTDNSIISGNTEFFWGKIHFGFVLILTKPQRTKTVNSVK